MGRAGRVRSSVPIATQVELAHHPGLCAHLCFKAHTAVPVSLQGPGAVTREGRAGVGRVSCGTLCLVCPRRACTIFQLVCRCLERPPDRHALRTWCSHGCAQFIACKKRQVAKSEARLADACRRPLAVGPPGSGTRPCATWVLPRASQPPGPPAGLTRRVSAASPVPLGLHGRAQYAAQPGS